MVGGDGRPRAGARRADLGGDDAEGRTEKHAREVRGRSEEFLGHIGEIEARREAVVTEIRRNEEVLGFLDADLEELLLIEEERLEEWEIERELIEPDRTIVMPWAVRMRDGSSASDGTLNVTWVNDGT